MLETFLFTIILQEGLCGLALQDLTLLPQSEGDTILFFVIIIYLNLLVGNEDMHQRLGFNPTLTRKTTTPKLTRPSTLTQMTTIQFQ